MEIQPLSPLQTIKDPKVPIPAFILKHTKSFWSFKKKKNCNRTPKGKSGCLGPWFQRPWVVGSPRKSSQMLAVVPRSSQQADERLSPPRQGMWGYLMR